VHTVSTFWYRCVCDSSSASICITLPQLTILVFSTYLHQVLVGFCMFQDFLEDVGSLISMQLGGMTLDGLSTLFDQYVNLLIKAVPNLDEDEEPGTENSARRKVERQIETTSKTYDVVNVFCICMSLKWLLGNDWNLYMYEHRDSLLAMACNLKHSVSLILLLMTFLAITWIWHYPKIKKGVLSQNMLEFHN
jgi:hypothetical protein